MEYEWRDEHGHSYTADLTTMAQWARDGRIEPSSTLVHKQSGRECRAEDLQLLADAFEERERDIQELREAMEQEAPDKPARRQVRTRVATSSASPRPRARSEQQVTPEVPYSTPWLPGPMPAQHQQTRATTLPTEKNCPFCAETIKAEAIVCRFCGRDLGAKVSPIGILKQPVGSLPPAAGATTPPKTSGSGNTLATLVLLFLLLGGGWLFLPAFLTGTGGSNSSQNGIPLLADLGPQSVISAAEYGSLHNGMSYSDAVGVIGQEGEESGNNHMDGVPGVMAAIDTKLYSWKNADGSNAIVTFQNDKLVSKAQYGLK